MRTMFNRGNGHNRNSSGMAQGGGNGFNYQSASDLERLFAQSEMPSVVKEFVRPGNSARDLMMRCKFRDDNEKNNAVAFLRKCEEFGLTPYKEMLIDWMAASVSVGGLSRKEVLQATTGIIAPVLYGKGPQRRTYDEEERR